jgi:Tol biopolymer transport system component
VDLPTPYNLAVAAPTLVFSPDGRSLVIPAIRSNVRYLFLLRLDDGRPTLIPGTLQARSPAFSPDGRWLAFMAGGKLMKVALDGGTPIALTEAAGWGVWLVSPLVR